MTAAGLGRFMDQGRLELDVEIREYVPYFPPKKYPVTMPKAGGHMGGIRHYQGGEILSAVHYPDVAAVLEIFMYDPLIAVPWALHTSQRLSNDEQLDYGIGWHIHTDGSSISFSAVKVILWDIPAIDRLIRRITLNFRTDRINSLILIIIAHGIFNSPLL